MLDLALMDLEEMQDRLYDLAVLLRRDDNCPFAGADLDEKFKLYYGSYVPVTQFGFGNISELLDGSRWFIRTSDDPDRFRIMLRENFQFAYKLPKNPEKGKIFVNLEPEAWLLHIKKELEPDPPPTIPDIKVNDIKQEREEIPPPASPDPSPTPSPTPSPSTSPLREVMEPEIPLRIPTDWRALSVPVMEEVCDASNPRPKSTVKPAHLTGQMNNQMVAHRAAVGPTPTSFNASSPAPTPMRILDGATEMRFQKLYNAQIAAAPHLQGPVSPGNHVDTEVERFVGSVEGILKTLGGRARFDEVEMKYREQKCASFARLCVEHLSLELGPFSVLRQFSSGKIETEILGPRLVYFRLKTLPDAVPQPTSAAKSISVKSSLRWDSINASRLMSTNSNQPFVLKSKSVMPQKKAWDNVNPGPSRFGNIPCSKASGDMIKPFPSRFGDIPCFERPEISRDRSRSRDRERHNRRWRSRSHQRSRSREVSVKRGVDGGPIRFGNCSFSKTVVDRLISCFRRAPAYRITDGEMTDLYRNLHGNDLLADLLRAFATTDLHQLKSHEHVRGKVDIYHDEQKGWVYRLEPSQRPLRSFSRNYRRSSSRSRQRSRSHERRLRSKRSSSPSKHRRSRSHHRSPSPHKNDVAPSRRSRSRHSSRSKEERNSSRRRTDKTTNTTNSVALGSEAEVGSSEAMKKKKTN